MRVSDGSGGWNRGADVFGCIALLVLFVLVGGCARSQSPRASSDGQSHWLQTCTASSECGEYACICGTCTRACSDDTACAVKGKGGVCKSAEELASADRCDGDPALIAVCAPRDDGATTARGDDAGVVGSGGQGVLGSGGRGAVGSSGTSGDDTPGGGFASAPRGSGGSNGGPVHSLSFTPDVDPPRLDCAGLSAEAWPAGVELLHTFGEVAMLIADDTTVYGATLGNVLEDEPVWRYREPAGPVEPLLSPAFAPYPIVIDGDELFFGRTRSDSGWTKVTLSTGEQTVLVSDPTLQYIGPATLDGGYLYWGSDHNEGTLEAPIHVEHIERTDRVTGVTDTLAELPGQTSLVAMNGVLYVLVAGVDDVPEHTQVLRMPADGSDVLRPLSPVASIYSLERSGGGVFMRLDATRDEVGNVVREGGVAALDLEDGSIRMLAEEPNVVAGPLADDTFVYWASQEADTLVVTMWRTPKDGSGDAERIAYGWTTQEWMGLAQTQSALYWTIPCDSTGVTHLLRLAKK